MSLSEEFTQQLTEATPKVYAFLLSRGLKPHVAEDFTQEALLKALAYLKKYNNESTIKNATSWLMTIALNASIAEFRKSGRRETALETDSFKDGGKLSKLGLEEFSVSNENAYFRTYLSEIYALMQHFPAAEKRALQLMAIEGYTSREAAELCSEQEDKTVSPLALRLGLLRARQRLENVLEKDKRRILIGLIDKMQEQENAEAFSDHLPR